MEKERMGADSIILEGKMWVTGGNDKSQHRLNSTELINPHQSNKEFSNSSEKQLEFYIDLPDAVCRFSIIKLNDTTSFLIAGWPENSLQSDKTYYFHHMTNTWTNGPPLKTSRKLHTAGVIKDRVTLTEHIVVAGGTHNANSVDETLDSVEIMLNNENKWNL